MRNPGLLYIKLSKAQLKALKPIFDYAAHQYEQGQVGIVLAQARAEDNYPQTPDHPWAGKLQVGFLDHDTANQVAPIVKQRFASKDVEQ